MGELAVRENPNLVSLEGLEGLTRVEYTWYTGGIGSGDIIITDNDLLEDLTGLDNLVYVEDLNITENASLVDLSGLNRLAGIGSLEVSGNASLETLDGVSPLSPEGVYSSLCFVVGH